MNLFTTMMAFLALFSASAFAHTDHGLGNGTFHEFYHIAFWLIFAAVVVKAIHWFRTKKNDNKKVTHK